MERRSRVILSTCFGILLFASGLGYANAQDDGSASEVDVPRTANVGPAEQVARAQEIQTSGATLSRRVSAMLDEARQERDIIRVTCLNDKLTQINANTRSIDDRVSNLESMSEAGDTSGGAHEFTVITVLGQKLQVLDQEASQCIGEDLFETGATTVTTEVDPGTPTEDPGVVPTTPASPIPYIPPPASGDS